MLYTLYIFSAFFLDFLLGDPRWFPHPVKGIGLVCRVSENFARKFIKNELLAGTFTVISVLTVTIGLIFVLLTICYTLSVVFGNIVAIILLYMTFASRDLICHSLDVHSRLTRGELDGARKAVGRIVGRDTRSLNESEICRACVETVAENMVDGITAPFFFAVLFSFFSPYFEMSAIGCSVVGAFFYKAVNTMDSMIGYKNDMYLHFGRLAARLDDVVNFIPARISSFALIIAAFFLKLDYRRAAKIFYRDRLHHSSPNAGHTEAVVAGALGIRLGGPLFYLEAVVDKPYIGDNNREIETADIKICNRMILVGSFIFVISVLFLRYCFFN